MNYFVSCLRHSLPCYQHIEYRQPFDIIYRLLMGHHGEIIAIELKDLIVNSEATPTCSAVLHHLSHIDSVVLVPLWALPVILVDAATNLEATLVLLLVQRDRDGEALNGSAWLVAESLVRH